MILIEVVEPASLQPGKIYPCKFDPIQGRENIIYSCTYMTCILAKVFFVRNVWQPLREPNIILSLEFDITIFFYFFSIG